MPKKYAEGGYIEGPVPMPLIRSECIYLTFPTVPRDLLRFKLKEMAMKYVDIRVWFNEEVEDGDDESYVHLDACKVEPIGNNFEEGQGYTVAEAAGQSDFYQVAVANAMLLALDGKTVTEFD